MAGRLDSVHLDVVRTANGAVRAAAAASGEARSFLCECGDAECARSVVLTAAEYDEVRLGADPRIIHPACGLRETGAAPTDRRSLRVRAGRLLRALWPGRSPDAPL